MHREIVFSHYRDKFRTMKNDNGIILQHIGFSKLSSPTTVIAGTGDRPPVSARAVSLAGIAGVNPMKVVERTALPCIVALVVMTAGMFPSADADLQKSSGAADFGIPSCPCRRL